MKSSIVAFAFFFSVSSFAQSVSWSLTEVPGPKEAVGYIYHTYAIGTTTYMKSQSKVTSGLRFVCSSKGNPDPTIAIFWNGPLQVGSKQELEITVDKIARLNPTWIHDSTIIYSPAQHHPDLISALKRGRVVKFAWNANGTRYETAFPLNNFNLNSFNSLCKTNL